MRIVLPHGARDFSACSLEQVLQICARFASVVGDSDAEALETLHTMFRYRVMQETPQGVRPFISIDDVVEPGEIADVLALLGSMDIFGAVTELTYEPIAVLGVGKWIASATLDENLKNLSQGVCQLQVPRQADLPVLKNGKLLAGTRLKRWLVGSSRCGAIKVLAEGNIDFVVRIGTLNLRVWKLIRALIDPLPEAKAIIEPALC